jgi:large subunit ribosomal protein L10
MSKARDDKKQIVEALKQKVKKTKSLVFVDYIGLTVAEDTALRREYRDNKIDYKVYKNTLMRRALNELGHKEFDASLSGPTAFAFNYDDEIAAAKIAVDAVEKFKKTGVKCAMVDGKFYDGKATEELAKLPAKEVLVAQALSMLSAPVAGLVSVLSGTLKSLLYVLNAQIKNAK